MGAQHHASRRGEGKTQGGATRCDGKHPESDALLDGETRNLDAVADVKIVRAASALTHVTRPDGAAEKP